MKRIRQNPLEIKTKWFFKNFLMKSERLIKGKKEEKTGSLTSKRWMESGMSEFRKLQNGEKIQMIKTLIQKFSDGKSLMQE